MVCELGVSYKTSKKVWLFESRSLTNIQKEDVYTSMIKIYLDSKENN